MGSAHSPTSVNERSVSLTKGLAVGRRGAIAIVLLVMVGLIVGLDVAFFGHHFWLRLVANIGIVLAFASFSLRYLRRS